MQNNKLNIGIIGYGKMGKIIEKMALSNNHQIMLRTNSKNPLSKQIDKLKDLDVAIEFTSPELAVENLNILSKNKIPTICGTTAWLDHYEDVVQKFKENETSFLYASNFSIGVNIFFRINSQLAKIMNKHSQYEPSIYESHHLEKKDAPSGTAVTIASQMIAELNQKSSWSMDEETNSNKLQIKADRIGDVKGYHEVNYTSVIDKLSISHEAFSREGFAQGAILSAEWIVGKKGIFFFNDVLGI